MLFLSLVVSSCGLGNMSSSPDQPTDSKPADTASSESAPAASTDDLFSKAMNEAGDKNTASDAPSNITSENTGAVDDISENTPEEAAKITEAKVEPKKDVALEVKIEEAIPKIKEDEISLPISENSNADAGKIVSYKVQKGETLMQIAFKVYGDVSKWKSIKQMNSGLAGMNSSLRSGMEIKYKAPQNKFEWNPEGTPHMIKTGETLGTISKEVYQTPKKWKNIWENNKPLIKNPNVIYAGFTLYCKSSTMANYVQPKGSQKVVVKSQREIEEVKIDQAISDLEGKPNNQEIVDLTTDVQSAPVRNDKNFENDTKEEVTEDL